jgi:hypothetical protein
MKTFAEWVNENFPSDMTNALNRKVNFGNLGGRGQSQASNQVNVNSDQNDNISNIEYPYGPRLPATGDKAYSNFEGNIRTGYLLFKMPTEHMIKMLKVKLNLNAALVHNPEESYKKDGNLICYVGNDEPIKWDSKKGMWFAPVDD